MRFKHPWPPVSPVDEKFYHIELKDGSIVENVEYWSFGGGFSPNDGNGFESLCRYPMEEVVSFQPTTPQ